MNRLADHFDGLRAKQERALIVFVTAGDPSLDQLPAILETLTEAGADAIEVGIPFSDPFGEGPTIQASSYRSLERGTTPFSVLDSLGKVSLPIPLLTMGYYNPLLAVGLERFAQASAEAGVSGTIVSDLVPDEAESWVAASRHHGLDTVFLVAPTSTDQRVDDVCRTSTGFVYAVSRTGVTGAENAVPPEVGDLVDRVRAKTSTPICVGFGISRPEHVAMVTARADGAVVGSSLVQLLHDEWNQGRGAETVKRYVASLKEATWHVPIA
jgi:tryptophan synthase alpha chain